METSQNTKETQKTQLFHTAEKKQRKYSGWTQASTQPTTSFIKSKSNKASFILPQQEQQRTGHYNLFHSQESSKENPGKIKHSFQINFFEEEEPQNQLFNFKKNGVVEFPFKIIAFSNFNQIPFEEKILKIKANDFISFLNKICIEISKKNKEKKNFEKFSYKNENEGDFLYTQINQNEDKISNLEEEITLLRSKIAKIELEKESILEENKNLNEELTTVKSEIERERRVMRERETKLGEIYKVFLYSVKEYKKGINLLHNSIDAIDLSKDLGLAIERGDILHFGDIGLRRKSIVPANSPQRKSRVFNYNTQNEEKIEEIEKLSPFKQESFETLDVGASPHFLPENVEKKLNRTCKKIQKKAVDFIRYPKKVSKKQKSDIFEFLHSVEHLEKLIKEEIDGNQLEWFEIEPEMNQLIREAKKAKSKRKVAKNGRRRTVRDENVNFMNNSFVY